MSRSSDHRVVVLLDNIRSLYNTGFEWIPQWPVCLVFGHEREGVSPTLTSHVQTVIRIPMLGHKRSLNVATAAGVVLYELLRNRLYEVKSTGPDV